MAQHGYLTSTRCCRSRFIFEYYHLDQGDRLLSTSGADPATYTWDANGNMLSKTTPEGTTSYIWNARDKLTSVELPQGGTNHYSYYPESDLRYSKIDGQGEEKRFLCDGQNVIEELDGYNFPEASYIEGTGIDQHIARVENGNVYAYVSDPLGTVRSLVDGSTQPVNSYTYEAYGETRSKTEGVDNPYLFTGRRLDGGTGDYYYRARYYQPNVGRFTSVDPLAPNEMTYGYVYGNPTNFNDPSGLTKMLYLSDLGWLIVDREVLSKDRFFMVEATSGLKSGMNNPKEEHIRAGTKRSVGPIPKGNYYILKKDMDDPNWVWDFFIRNQLGLGPDWGDWRIKVRSVGKPKYGRTKFYMHGGQDLGSAGCIDLGGGIYGDENTNAVRDAILADPDGKIELEVTHSLPLGVIISYHFLTKYY